jgi:hypothetical protein
VNSYLPYFRQRLICHLLSACYFSRLCLLIVCVESCLSSFLQWRGLSVGYFCRFCLLKACRESSSLLLLPHLVHSKSLSLSAAYSFQFLVYYSVFFCVGWGSVCPGSYAGLSQRWLLEYHVPLICSPVGLCLPSRFGADSGGTGAFLFSQCNVSWRSFVQAGGLRCWSFDSSWCFFFCQVWLQHLSKVFDLWSSHCLLPPCSSHLGSPHERILLSHRWWWVWSSPVIQLSSFSFLTATPPEPLPCWAPLWLYCLSGAQLASHGDC